MRQSKKKRTLSFLHSRRFRYGGFSAALTAVLLTIVLLGNLVFGVLVANNNWTIDLTGMQAYSLSAQTVSFLQNYDKKAEIIVLDDEASFRTQSSYSLQAYNVLKNMAAQNGGLTLSFTNLDENPGFASQYADVSPQTGGIMIVDQAGHHRYIAPTELFQSQTDANGNLTELLSNVEQSVAHALEYVSGENPVATAVVQGHSEADISSIETTLQSNGYSFSDLNLTTGDIPAGTSLVLLAAPTVDYTADEIAKLTAYLDGGGSIAYFASARQPDLPRLYTLLQAYGITFTQGTVADTNTANIAGSSPNSFYVYAAENDYTQNMPDTTLPILVTDCMPMEITDAANVETAEIISTADSCINWLSDENFDHTTAEQKSFAVGIGSSKPNGSATARVTAFASLQILAGLSTPTYGNGGLIISALGTTANHQSAVTVLPKSLASAQLGITSAQLLTIGIIFIAALPIAVAVAGTVLCLRRKRRR